MEENKGSSVLAPIRVCEAESVNGSGKKNGCAFKLELYANRIVVEIRSQVTGFGFDRMIIPLAHLRKIRTGAYENYFYVDFDGYLSNQFDYNKTEELKDFISALEELL